MVPKLGIDEIHIWRADLDQERAHVNHFAQMLPLDEMARAARFHFERDRIRFILAHGILRVILAHYLGIEPSIIAFHYNAYNKPALTNNALKFNLAHSRHVAVYAITNVGEVGVDVERIRSFANMDAVAQNVFSAREYATWNALPDEEKTVAFFHGWTRKEAFIKAKGLGVSLALNSFDVTLAPDEPARLLATHYDSSDKAHWILNDIDMGQDFAVAIATRNRNPLPIQVVDYVRLDEEILI